MRRGRRKKRCISYFRLILIKLYIQQLMNLMIIIYIILEFH